MSSDTHDKERMEDTSEFALPPLPQRASTYGSQDNSSSHSILGGRAYSHDLPGSSSSMVFAVPTAVITDAVDAQQEDGYVEFDMGASSDIVTKDPKYLERIGKIQPQLVRLGKGSGSSLELQQKQQPSKQTDVTHDTVQELVKEHEEGVQGDEEDSDSDSEWKQMDTAISYGIYDNKGQKLENMVNPSRESLGNEDVASKGYTRVAAQEQATKYSNIDKNFDFLFKNEESNLKKLHMEAGDTEEEESEESDTFVKESMSPETQLHSTKKILKDSQKIAYVGLVRLVIVEMATNLAMIRSTNSVSTMKKLSAVQGSFENWSMKIMGRLYEHMDLSNEELKMIESLSSHGVEPRDLAPSLNTKETVDNPLHEDLDSGSTELTEDEESKPGVLRPEDLVKQKTLDIDVRWTVVCDLFLILLQDSVYDARSRTLLLKFGEYLDISSLEISQFERRITDAMEIEENAEQTWNEQDILTVHKKRGRKRKYVAIGLATIGGSLVIGLSAGLLAPVIGAGLAAGLSTVGIAGTSGFLAGVGGTTIVTTGAVIAGGKIGMSGMSKRIGSVKTFEFRPLHNNGRVNLIVTVSGWMSGTLDDVRLPFSTVDPVMGDLYSLLWEPELLTSMGQTINILATEVLTQSVQQILGSTILVALMSAVQIPLVLTKLGYLLDNPWNVSLDRAWSAGLVLADTLIGRNLGVRPVTLVGFSLGARLIYSCLLELAKQGAHGLVENVIIFGAPVVQKTDQLALARSVVSGKFINGYSKRDWILGYLFRATSGGLRTVAGLSPIEGIAGIENFDCTEHVQGHMEYRKVMPKLLAELNWEVLDEEFVEIDEPDVEQTERQRKLISDFEEAREKMQKQPKKSKTWTSWLRPRKKEWWEIYEEGKQQLEEHECDTVEGMSSETEPHKSQDVIFDLQAIKEEVANIEKVTIDTKEFKLNKKIEQEIQLGLLPAMPTTKLAEDAEEEEEDKLDREFKERKSHKIFQLSPKKVGTQDSLEEPSMRSFKTKDHTHGAMRSPSVKLNVVESDRREAESKEPVTEADAKTPPLPPYLGNFGDEEFPSEENIQMTFQ